MKLLTRTTIYYSLFTVPLLALAGWAFYNILLKEINGSLDESLTNTRHALERYIDTLDTPTDFVSPDGDSRFYYHKGSANPHPLSFRDTMIYFTHEYLPYRLLSSQYRTRDGYYEIRIRKAAVETEDVAEGIVQAIILTFFILLIGLVFMNWLVTRYIWKPFHYTISFLKNYRIGLSHETLPEKTLVKEFNDLNNSLNEVMTRIDKDYYKQKEFTENASHEMQTPVAVMRSKMDLLIQSQNLKEEEMQLIHSMANALKRLSHLNKSLLLLSKIENRQFPETEDIDVREMVEAYLAMYESTILEKEVSVSVVEHDSLTWKMNRGLCEILINNLIQNALRHNHAKGNVAIVIANNALSINNSGERMNDEQHIYKRFNKSNQSTDSVGLGLAITKEIVDASGFTISYLYTHNIHQFTIQ